MTDEIQKMKAEVDLARKEYQSATAAHMRAEEEKRTNNYNTIYNNLFSGVAYKYDIPKSQLEQFIKDTGRYMFSVLMSTGNYPKSIDDLAPLIDHLENFTKTWQYKQSFEEILK